MVRPKTKTEHATLDFNSALTWSASTTIALQVIDEGKRQGGFVFFWLKRWMIFINFRNTETIIRQLYTLSADFAKQFYHNTRKNAQIDLLK